MRSVCRGGDAGWIKGEAWDETEIGGVGKCWGSVR